MNELRKITVQVPERDLEMAQDLTGEGVTETVRAGLKKLASRQGPAANSASCAARSSSRSTSTSCTKTANGSGR